jgi:hypothetical protein
LLLAKVYDPIAHDLRATGTIAVAAVEPLLRTSNVICVISSMQIAQNKQTVMFRVGISFVGGGS